ncbi:MAG: ribulose-phosphate 3-epimerase [Flavobacteriales bacterium]
MARFIAPSVLSADFARLGADIEMINQSEADWFHVDIMDGRFVPNISFGFPVMEALKKHATKMLDVHLMIEEPLKYVDEFVEKGAGMLTIHWEADRHIHRSIQAIHKAGAKAGVAINPGTPVHILKDIIKDADMILLMSVNPGFGGQSFIENTYARLEELNALRNAQNPQCWIEIDGGVNDKNAPELVRLGADALVAGNYVFKAEDPQEAIKRIKAA